MEQKVRRKRKPKAIPIDDEPSGKAHAKLVKVERVFNTEITIPGYTYATTDKPEVIFRYTYQIL